VAENWLKAYNFNALQLPRQNLAPHDVLLRENGSFDTKAGDLTMLFASAEKLSEVPPGEPMADIERRITRKLKVGLGVRLLAVVFGGAASKLGAATSLSKAHTIDVTYEDVEQTSTALLKLQTWIEQAKVQTSKQGMVWLNDGRLAVIVAVLHTKRLSFVATDSTGARIQMDVPEIQGIVKGAGKLERDREDTSRLNFTGDSAIAFGYQAYVMKFSGNVSFGLERAKGLGKRDYGPQAWTADKEIPKLRDGAIPG
jgi:hypothetical protein